MWQSTKDLFVEYADHSTIHGVSYIAEKGRSWIEKVWWITVFCLSVLLCGKLIYAAWNINPIIISFTEKSTPIWQIPFPAITICPRTFTRAERINMTKLFQYEDDGEEVFQNFTEKEKKQALAKSMMCVLGYLLEDTMNVTDCNDCLSVLREFKIPIGDVFMECRFQNRVIDCTNAFIETIVGYQLCYTFNEPGIYRLSSEHGEHLADDWSIDEGYKPGASINTFPHRAVGAGPKFGFSILLGSDTTNSDVLCTPGDAFALEYRMPNESPQLLTKFFLIPMRKSVDLMVTPRMMTTSDEVQNYSPAKRQCYLSSEYRLKYFKQYTQSNCEIECQVDLVVQRCGCLPIYIESNCCGLPSILRHCICHTPASDSLSKKSKRKTIQT